MNPERIYRLILCISLISAGCSFFEPRESEPPSGREGRWDEPVSPGIVISNLNYAFQDENIEDYMSAFTSQFLFLADERDTLLFEPGTFTDWGFSIEEEVTGRIFAEAYSINLTFSDSLVDSTADLAHFYENYEFTVSAESQVYGKGLALFSLSRGEDGYWAIYEWQDFKKDTTDWGFLKGIHR